MLCVVLLRLSCGIKDWQEPDWPPEVQPQMRLPPWPGGDAPRETQPPALPPPPPLSQPTLSGSFCMRTCSGGEWLDRQNSAEALELEIRAAMGRLVSVTQFVRALVSSGHLPFRTTAGQPVPDPQPNTAAAETSHSSHGALGLLFESPKCQRLCVCVRASPPLFIFLHYL